MSKHAHGSATDRVRTAIDDDDAPLSIQDLKTIVARIKRTEAEHDLLRQKLRMWVTQLRERACERRLARDAARVPGVVTGAERERSAEAYLYDRCADEVAALLEEER